MLNIRYISNETNTDVHMYIEEFILDLLALLYKLELIYIGKYTGLYNRLNRLENILDISQMSIHE